MPTIDELKEQSITPTPLVLFECTFRDASVKRWATHAVTFEAHAYEARVLGHNVFESAAASADGFDGVARVGIVLGNADSLCSQIESSTGFKGTRLTARFLFFDLRNGVAASEARVVFRGIGNAPDEITDSALKASFTNQLSLQRVLLPEVRIGRLCPWSFPTSLAERQIALDGDADGTFSSLYRCGYSADLAGGAGNLDGAVPFTSCDFTRESCIERGMFREDSSSHPTARFGGVEFVPPQITVRSFGEKGNHLSPVVANEARYNDVVPLVYGTVWYQPPAVFARNDGNLTRLEVLLGMGQMDAVVTVVVNGVEIPASVAGSDMTATGWYTTVSQGTRNGAFNPDFTDGAGQPIGDPYGSMAFASIVVPNSISNGQALPKVQILVRGLRLETFDTDGDYVSTPFTNNPAWVLLDVLRRSGWKEADIDLASFASAASHCDAAISTTDLYGNTALIPRYQTNLVVRSRVSAADVVRGIKSAANLILSYGASGLLSLKVEGTLAVQQDVMPSGSNSIEELNGGWPAYEFSDASAGFSGILRNGAGAPSIRVFSKGGGDLPNRLSVEFQDQFNEYQQDSLALVDIPDTRLVGREITGTFSAVGIPNYDQAARVLGLNLARSLGGNRFVELETTFKGVGLQPGDLITLTYLKEGFVRQPFRLIRVAPGNNFQTIRLTAQLHNDAWYEATGFGKGIRRRETGEPGIPRPLVGTVIDSNGQNQFAIAEEVIPTADGGFRVELSAEFVPPVRPGDSSAEIPLLSLTPTISTTGGTLAGGQDLYYALAAIDASGNEGSLSFAVRAHVPTTTNTNKVTLTGLVFSDSTDSFNVYRGSNPSQLLKIASEVTPAATFEDAGAVALAVGPPDANYDRAKFYWRIELQPEFGVSTHSATTVGNSTLTMFVDGYKGAIARITRGKGAGQERIVASNTTTTITLTGAWAVEPDSTSYFVVAENTWKLGGISSSSPVHFEVSNRPGATVHVSGRATNIRDEECSEALSPLTRWQMTGGAGSADEEAPPKPTFGLSLTGHGTVDIGAIGFPTLANTHTIYAGVLNLFYWNELDSPSTVTLATGVDDDDTTISLSSSTGIVIGTLIQIGGEILEVEDILNSTDLQAIRAAYESTAASHTSGDKVYILIRQPVIVPFVKGFFGSPASGSFVFPIFVPNVRIGAAEFYVLNQVGNSLVAKNNLGYLTEQGLRTLSGGQISIQVEGYLAIQESAAPAFVVDTRHAVNDLYAVVREAPDGDDIVMEIRHDGTLYATLTIPDGDTVSNVVNGFGLPPLESGGQLTLDITSVPGAPGTLPGRDLTVTIRL